MSKDLEPFNKLLKFDITLFPKISSRLRKKVLYWKLFERLQNMALMDFDEFIAKVPGDSIVLSELLTTPGMNYSILFDNSSYRLRFNLDKSEIWKQILSESDNNFNDWYIEFKNHEEQRKQRYEKHYF